MDDCKVFNNEGPLDTRRGYHPSPIDPYMDDLKQDIKLGMTVKQMEQSLRKKVIPESIRTLGEGFS